MAATSETTIGSVLKNGAAPRFMLVSDLDHTMVQNEDKQHARLLKFNRTWTTHFASDSILVFSTGRSPNLFAELWDEAPLLAPDVLICSVGTEIFYRVADGSLHQDQKWVAQLDQGWDRQKVLDILGEYSELQPQASSEQRAHKLSYHLDLGSPEAAEKLLDGVAAKLAAAQLSAKIIYSGGVDVDVVAQGAGKGKALDFVLQQLQAIDRFPKDGVQVNGDSGNDIELFQVPKVHGCVVANCHPELRKHYDSNKGDHIFLATEPCSGGIVQALEHFGHYPATPARDTAARSFIAAFGQRQALLGNESAPDKDPNYLQHLLATLPELADPECLFIGCTGDRTYLSQFTALTRDAASSTHIADASKETTEDGQLAAASASGALNWVDALAVKPLSSASEAEGLWLVAYQLWSHKGGRRNSSNVVQCTAVVRQQQSAQHGGKLLHLHESYMKPASTPTAFFLQLVAQH